MTQTIVREQSGLASISTPRLDLQQTFSPAAIHTHSSSPLALSPNDWLMPATSSIHCIYFYPIQQWPFFTKQDTGDFMNVERLISSLRKLLEFYPQLTGTLRSVGDDHKASLEYPDEGGVSFTSASVDTALSDLPLGADEYIDIKRIPGWSSLVESAKADSLFCVRHTRFACGSVALGIALSHQLADGHSYFQLVGDWARLYENEDYRPDVCHQRSLLQPAQNAIERLKQSNPDFDNRRSLCLDTEVPPSTPQTGESAVRVFRFTADELERMKSDAVAHLPPNLAYLSTFEVLTAHLYQHAMLARYPSAAPSTTRLYIATNTRPRLTDPPVPSTYFGNAVMLSFCQMPMAELLDASHLGSIAGQIHVAIQDNNNNDIRTTLAWVDCQADKARITPSWILDQADFTISAWNKMGMYTKADFESGVRPCRIALPVSATYTGSAVLFSTAEDDGSIDVVLGLSPDEMERLVQNAAFRKYNEQ